MSHEYRHGVGQCGNARNVRLAVTSTYREGCIIIIIIIIIVIIIIIHAEHIIALCEQYAHRLSAKPGGWYSQYWQHRHNRLSHLCYSQFSRSIGTHLNDLIPFLICFADRGPWEISTRGSCFRNVSPSIIITLCESLIMTSSEPITELVLVGK